MANDEKHLQEYLRNFFKAYHLNPWDLNPIARKELEELEEWCKNYLGKQYLDWHLLKRNYSHESYICDDISILYIREHKKCTLFELRWSESILKVVDKKYFLTVK